MQERMMALVRTELFGLEPDATLFSSMSEADWLALYKLAKHHDMAHLVGDAALRWNLAPEGEAKTRFFQATALAFRRNTDQEYQLAEIKRVLSDAHIPFLPLKGAVIRPLYPETWMRMSCDIDVLVRPADIDRATQVIVDALSYRADKKNYHDVPMYSPTGVHLELHFNIQESDDTIDALLKNAWDYAAPLNESACEYAFTPEFFLFHQLAHASYHFRSGGCGVKCIVDWYLLTNQWKYDREVLNGYLAQCNLLPFAQAVETLSRVWLEGAPADEVTDALAAFILRGGAYGTMDSNVAIGHVKAGGSKQYLLRRLWMPYEALVYRYPRVKGKRWLQPAYEVYRWLDLVRPSKRKRLADEWKTSHHTDEADRETLRKLFASLNFE